MHVRGSSDSITFIRNFVKIGRMVQKFKLGNHAYTREACDLTAYFGFFIKESRLQVGLVEGYDYCNDTHTIYALVKLYCNALTYRRHTFGHVSYHEPIYDDRFRGTSCRVATDDLSGLLYRCCVIPVSFSLFLSLVPRLTFGAAS